MSLAGYIKLVQCALSNTVFTTCLHVRVCLSSDRNISIVACQQAYNFMFYDATTLRKHRNRMKFCVGISDRYQRNLLSCLQIYVGQVLISRYQPCKIPASLPRNSFACTRGSIGQCRNWHLLKFYPDLIFALSEKQRKHILCDDGQIEYSASSSLG